MKSLKLLFLLVPMLMFATACSDEESTENVPEQEYDEYYYASVASISSSDANFSPADNGGAITFGSEGGAVVIDVDCGTEWVVDSGNAEVFGTEADFSTGKLTVTAEENTGEEALSGTVRLLTAAQKIEFAYITVKQECKAYIIPERERVTISASGRSVFVGVRSNCEWECSNDGSSDWLSVEKNGDELTLTAVANDSEESREGVVSLTPADGSGTGASLTVVQSAYQPNALILTYTIADGGQELQLPLSETVDCTVDWGDGDMESVTSEKPTHTYAKAGEYTVTIDGTVSRLDSFATPSASRNRLTAVNQWGKTGLTSMEYAFMYCANLASIPDSADGAFEEVVSFMDAFYGCDSITKLKSGVLGNCPKAEKFNYCFAWCSTLTDIEGGLFDGCPNVTSFIGLFYWDMVLSSIPEGLFDNCPKVTDFGAAFYYCESVPSIPKGLFDKCPEVEDFGYVFALCHSITAIPEGLFDNCPKVEYFDWAFYSLQEITAIPDGLFANCPEVISFEGTFMNGIKIKAIPEGLFKVCSKVLTFNQTFNACFAVTSIPEDLFSYSPEAVDFSFEFTQGIFTSIPDKLFEKNTKAKIFQATFGSNHQLTAIPEGLFDNCPEATDFEAVFQSCSKVTTIPTGLFDNNLNVTNFQSAFQNISAAVVESPYTELADGTKVHLYEREAYATELGCAVPEFYSNCFYNCTSMTDYYNMPSSWTGITDETAAMLSQSPSRSFCAGRECPIKADINVK